MPSCDRVARAAAWLLAAATAGLGASVLAQEAARPVAGIYSCTDAQGRVIKRDRPIAECSDREQKIQNPDGSVKGTHPPSLTADERAEREARERRAAEEARGLAEAGRRDKQLKARYPTEASHQQARAAALDNVRRAIREGELRLRQLEAERKPLLNEAEFYQGRNLPPKLKQALEANEASAAAQRQASANQESELRRLTAFYDAELERLRRLWAGALPGSMGPLVAPAAPEPVSAASAPKKPAAPAR